MWDSGCVPALIDIPFKEDWMVTWMKIKDSECERMSRAVEMFCSYYEWRELYKLSD